MILNVSSRTDIPSFYSKWLLKRFKEGFVYVKHPMYPDKISKLELNNNLIDCIVFCSKNYKPLLNDINKITNNFNTYFYYTITAYDKEIEPKVPSINKSIDTLIELSNKVGKERVSWRYDPILITEDYTIKTHIKAFEYIASKLAPYIDRCVFSFVDMYKKLEKNMPEIIPLNQKDKNEIAKNIGHIAKKYNFTIQTCATDYDYTKYGIEKASCINLNLLGKANNIKFKDLKHKGQRPGCHCIETRDIGEYNSCLNGCKYCYANKTPKKAIHNYKFHDKDSPLLIGHIKKSDTITKANQKSFLKKEYQNIKNNYTLDFFK
ncbi:hypothetical protein BGI41_06530 [Methanobrevibacter sp. 87.7]|uniref:DUF1848 domain-containing protein n=1 Tax=Methanobrevibacter sp. 87.7 TaxID=387957 RepID=UPI000B513E59|nr:DUF1848 domain-containing protein [Methanobrevibacter sp. 87.7]OWT32664.1 hypothetical protein BGI41_06530 [Methanobrevibacter sp. 87.7]